MLGAISTTTPLATQVAHRNMPNHTLSHRI